MNIACRQVVRWVVVGALVVTVAGCRRTPAAPVMSQVDAVTAAHRGGPNGASAEAPPGAAEEHDHAIGPEHGSADEDGAGHDDASPGPGQPDPSRTASGVAPADPPRRQPPADDRLAGASFRNPVDTPSPSTATVNAVRAPGACWKELQQRKLPFVRSKRAAAGVATAVQSSGPLNGVRLVIPRAPSPYGVLDCRLALALDEMTKVLAAEGVVEIQIDNTHRPRAKLPRRGAGKSQHAYGLAADVTRMKLADGTQLRVDRHWGAAIGEVPCGPDAPMDPVTPEAIALRGLVCELARRGVFHHLLTPSFDAAHRDHLHLDIKRGEKRTRIR